MDALLEFEADLLAEHLVTAGRVVPGLTVDADGRGRSWWWPLPALSDRVSIARHLPDGSADAQSVFAERLAEATDRLVRERLVAARTTMLAPRPGRRSVPEAWLRSLAETDPYLPRSLAPDRLRGLATEVEAWVRSGAAIPGSVRLCLRVLEPDSADQDISEQDITHAAKAETAPDSRWKVEVLVQDPEDTALLVPIAELFAGTSLFAPHALEDALRAVATAVRLAPELLPVLSEAVPTAVNLDAASVIRFMRERHMLLSEAGITVLLPSWWAKTPRLGLRAKVSSPSVGSGAAGGVGFDDITAFSWTAALGDEELTAQDLEVLEQAVAAKQELVRFRGQWIEVDAARLDAILERVGSIGEAPAGQVIRAALGLTDLGDFNDVEIEILGIDATGWIGDLLADTTDGRVEPVESPPGFAGELRAYQQRGVGWLQFLGRLGLGACLADDMGLGKTAQLIGAILADDAGGPTLVVCPVSVLGNWQREINRFAPGLAVMIHHGSGRTREPDEFAAAVTGHNVVLTTFSLLDRDSETFAAVTWGRLVLDEAQQIKNAGTKVARAARALPAHRRVALTGTPVENRLVELWSIMQFLNPGLLGSAASFQERFVRPIEFEHDPTTTERLGRITTPFILRRLKSDRTIITDLPDKIETVDHCPLTKEQVSLYQSVVDDLLAQAEKKEGIQRQGLVLAGITKLKQVCNHPAHFLGDNSAMAGRSGKLRRTEELLDEILAAGDKALIFTQFTAWGERLAPYLARRYGCETLWLHGGVARAERDTMVEQFSQAGGPDIMLLSLKAGGTGLNLVAASHVIHFDRWWNPAVENQATDRAYRIGQTNAVQVHKLVSAGSIEEKIDAMISGKRELADRVVGTGEKWLTELDTRELADVLRLSGEGED